MIHYLIEVLYMVFSSLQFLFVFLPVFLLVYYITPARAKNFILLLGSLLFYSYGNMDKPAYVLLMIFSIFMNFWFGIKIDRCKTARHRKTWMITGLVYNFFWLFLFKYLDFVLENINALLHMAGLSFSIPLQGLVLPIGISFYTFQIVSYLADVYRKTIKSEKSIVRLGTYLCMFPQLIAGPIVSYHEVSHALRKRKLAQWKLRTVCAPLPWA